MISPVEIERLRNDMTFWLKRWYRDPLAYVIECMGDIPTHQQAEILKAIQHHRFVAVKSGHGIGKTRLEGWVVNWWLDTRGLRVPITGPAGDQLEDVVFPEIVGMSRRKWEWMAKQYTTTTEELKYTKAPENWRAILRTARPENPDALQGFHQVMFIIDEGSGVDNRVFEVAEGAFGDEGNYGLMMGNPTKLSGYMYDVFHKKTFWYTLSFRSDESLTDEKYHYTYIDPLGNIRLIETSGRQTRGWVESMREKYGLNSNTYRIRVLGEFSQTGNDQLIDESWMGNLSGGSRIEKKEHKRIMGIDPAWTGDDDTAVVIRELDRIVYAESWHGFDLVESFGRIKRIWQEWDVDTGRVDTVGVGAGLYDMLKHAVYYRTGELGYPVIRVHCSERAPEDKDGACKTLRDWLWWKSRKYFRTRPVKFCTDTIDGVWGKLKTELLAPTYKIASNGNIVVESKDDMKKRGQKSPNLADALNTTFYQDYDLFRETYHKPVDSIRMRKKHKTTRSWKSR